MANNADETEINQQLENDCKRVQTALAVTFAIKCVEGIKSMPMKDVSDICADEHGTNLAVLAHKMQKVDVKHLLIEEFGVEFDEANDVIVQPPATVRDSEVYKAMTITREADREHAEKVRRRREQAARDAGFEQRNYEIVQNPNDPDAYFPPAGFHVYNGHSEMLLPGMTVQVNGGMRDLVKIPPVRITQNPDDEKAYRYLQVQAIRIFIKQVNEIARIGHTNVPVVQYQQPQHNVPRVNVSAPRQQPPPPPPRNRLDE